ncbi:hypothetical protein OEG84_03245 [Hoeflea sp. G2-23]|uniref:Uncharacterized protein n=1 Tax=Hoeflea algicola TaxID=2983763 RepID=A0ABT3Z4R8_9HYPH|nr:hypothetical protein [Hoeflea algicola]MCY0146757.1 hypothetical protein [Hoeflea algicola]
MTEPKDMIVPMLEEIRAEMTRAFDEVDKRFDGVDKRLDTIDGRQKSFNNALTADTMMGRFVTGDFEERIGELEKKVEQLIKGN